jgi:hypothetical protein
LASNYSNSLCSKLPWLIAAWKHSLAKGFLLSPFAASYNQWILTASSTTKTAQRFSSLKMPDEMAIISAFPSESLRYALPPPQSAVVEQCSGNVSLSPNTESMMRDAGL